MVPHSKIDPNEGNPVMKVLLHTTIPATAGALWGAGDHVFRGGEFNSNATVGKIIKGSALAGALGFFFFGGTFIVSQIRKKDDVFNNIAGVCATIPFLRNYMALHYAYPITVAMIGVVTAWKFLNIDTTGNILNERIETAKFGHVFDLTTLLKKPPGEPYLKHTPNSYL